MKTQKINVIGVSSNYKLVHKLMNKVIGEKKLTE